MEDTNLKQIIFNKLSKAKYEELKQAGQLNANEFYITPDESVTKDEFTTELAKKADKSDTYTKSQVDSAIESAIEDADTLPIQTGHSGHFLGTDGDTASWKALPTASDTTAGIVKMANSTEVTAGTSTTTAISPKDLKDAKDALTTEIDKKANSADVYTKNEIDGKLTGAFHYKGTKPSYDQLPSSGNEQGDVWNVDDTGANYAWTGTEWDKLSETVDLSGYYTKTQVDTELAKKADQSDLTDLESRIESLEETAEDLDDKFAAKADASDLNSFKSTVASTYETKEDATSKKNALEASIGELDDRIEELETSSSTYLTKTEASNTYATKADTYTKAQVDQAIADRIVAVIKVIE